MISVRVCEYACDMLLIQPTSMNWFKKNAKDYWNDMYAIIRAVQRIFYKLSKH